MKWIVAAVAVAFAAVFVVAMIQAAGRSSRYNENREEE